MNTRSPWCLWLAASYLILAGVSGCAGNRILEPANTRHFDFSQDTFAYANELAWEYQVDPASGKITTRQNAAKPEFSHRCFAVSRMARQFFQYAQFDPAATKLDDDAYRKAIATVVSRTPGEAGGAGKVVIPGYANLRDFSRAREALLKEATGDYLYSLFQFSNWRMIFPFSRDHQEATAQQLLGELQLGYLPIVHLIHFAPFPDTQIDHVVLIFGEETTAREIRFQIYDPNYFERPGVLIFERASRTFILPSTKYFNDGPLDVYEIFHDELD